MWTFGGQEPWHSLYSYMVPRLVLSVKKKQTNRFSRSSFGRKKWLFFSAIQYIKVWNQRKGISEKELSIDLNARRFFEKGANEEMLFLVKGSAEKCLKKLLSQCTGKWCKVVSALKTWKAFYWDVLEISVPTGMSVAITSMGIPFTFSFPTKPLEWRCADG